MFYNLSQSQKLRLQEFLCQFCQYAVHCSVLLSPPPQTPATVCGPSAGSPGWSAGSWLWSSRWGPGRRRPRASGSTRPAQGARPSARRCASASGTGRSWGSPRGRTSFLGARWAGWRLVCDIDTSAIRSTMLTCWDYIHSTRLSSSVYYGQLS